MIQRSVLDFQCRRSDTFPNGSCNMAAVQNVLDLASLDLCSCSRSGYRLRCGAGDCPLTRPIARRSRYFAAVTNASDLVLTAMAWGAGWPAIHAGQHHFVRLVQWRMCFASPCPAHYWHFDDDLDGLITAYGSRRRGTYPPDLSGFP